MISALIASADWDPGPLIETLSQQREIADIFFAGDSHSNVSATIGSPTIVGLGTWSPAAFNSAIRHASAEYVLLITSALTMRTSTLPLLIQTAQRHPGFSFIYADYVARSSAGEYTLIKLRDHTAGRLKEIDDYGAMLFFRKEALITAAGIDESFQYAGLYDLRLRLSELGECVHINVIEGGELYSVDVRVAGNDPYYYLRADRIEQLEYERACTQHLVRVGAYLRPTRPIARPPAATFAGEYEYAASVIIPVYRRPDFIVRALESTFAQTRVDFEVIVVCGGGISDPTIAKIEPYLGPAVPGERPAVSLELVDINNLGFMLNVGLMKARSPYYVQLDSDDSLKPLAVEAAVTFFHGNPDIAAATAYAEIFLEDESGGGCQRFPGLSLVTHDEWSDLNGGNNLLRVGGLGNPRLAHISAILACGGFPVNDQRSARNFGEDYELLLRLSERFRIGRIHAPLYEIYRHRRNTIDSANPGRYWEIEDAKDSARERAIARRILINRQLAEVGVAHVAEVYCS